MEFWLYCSGVPADEPGGKLELPLQATAAADFGFDAANVIRIVPHAKGASLTIARVDAGQARAEPVAELDGADPLFISIPLKLLGRHGGEKLGMGVRGGRGGGGNEEGSPRPRAGLASTRTPGPATAPAGAPPAA